MKKILKLSRKNWFNKIEKNVDSSIIRSMLWGAMPAYLYGGVAPHISNFQYRWLIDELEYIEYGAIELDGKRLKLIKEGGRLSFF